VSNGDWQVRLTDSGQNLLWRRGVAVEPEAVGIDLHRVAGWV